MSALDRILAQLRDCPAVGDKLDIRAAYAGALASAAGVAALGDDCAALPDGQGGHLLFAAEGLIEDFVADDPWFAGYCAILTNVNDVCAMGGRPIAVVDVVWTPDQATIAPLWDGMRAAAEAYGVPIVGGHTTRTRRTGGVHLAAAILGRASALLTSFDAQPGDELLMAVDLAGRYRGDKPFWNASVGTAPERLRTLMGLLPALAEHGWCRAAKDISNGGVIGTLVMLLEASGVGASLDLDALPRPAGVDRFRWLISFPSFGFLLSVAPEHSAAVLDLFKSHDVACGSVGRIDAERRLALHLAGEQRVFWNAREE